MSAFRLLGDKLAARQDIVIVAMLVVTLAMMVMPLPPILADVLIACNIALSVLVLMAAIQVASPVEFSTLPSLILLSTVFRLALSITTSRMV
jgi:type III secretion protein V